MRALRPAALIVLLALDRASKIWAASSLQATGSIPLLPFLSLTYVENTGAAFGMGRDSNRLFIAVSLVLIVGLHWLGRRWPQADPWLGWGKRLVTAGALGNLYDRLAYGYVVDMIHVHRFPVFNVADSCITVGACLLAWGLRDEQPQKSPANG